ncbi:uncharacterized protein [Macrobrachium rosenbergii]|uniref:uncharacterized protein n=1 Tax=Macrobrachium rosenbergii TaxID=79674 RepID=UPI0034D71161
MQVLLLLLSSVAIASAQTEAWCRCAAFVTYEHTEIMVYEAPEVTITACDAVAAEECKAGCVAELSVASDNGDLWHITEDGITIGQYICSYLAKQLFFYLHNHRVYGYYEVCGGAWQYADLVSQQMLCCVGGKHEHCVSDDSHSGAP